MEDYESFTGEELLEFIKDAQQDLVSYHKERDDAFEVFYNKYKKYVYVICFDFTQNTNMANDLLQDVFLKMLEAINKFDISKIQNKKYGVNKWIATVTQNYLLNLKEGEDESFEIVFQDELPEDTIENAEIGDKTPKLESYEKLALEKALSKFSERNRDLIRMYYNLKPRNGRGKLKKGELIKLAEKFGVTKEYLKKLVSKLSKELEQATIKEYSNLKALN